MRPASAPPGAGHGALAGSTGSWSREVPSPWAEHRVTLEVVPIRRHARHTRSLSELLGVEVPAEEAEAAPAADDAPPPAADVGSTQLASPLSPAPATPTTAPRPGTGALFTSSEVVAPLYEAESAFKLASLRAALEATELFAGLSPTKLDAVIARASVRVLPRYHVVYRAGARAEGQPLYVWLPGVGGDGEVRLNGAVTDEAARAAAARASAQAARAERKVAGTPGHVTTPFGAAAARTEVLDPAAVVFGVEGCARDAEERVRADTADIQGGPVTVLLVPAHALPPEAVQRATSIANLRLLRRVRGPSLFAEIPPFEMVPVAQELRVVHAKAGQVIAREGEDLPVLFTVVQGTVASWTGGEARMDARHAAGGAARRTNNRGAGGSRLSSSALRGRAASLGAAGRAARDQASAPITLEAESALGAHFGLEALSAWLQLGDEGRARVTATYVAETPAWLVVATPAAFALMFEAVGALAVRTEALFVNEARLREAAQQAALKTREIASMRSQCRVASWNRFGAPIDNQIDLKRVYGKPVIPTSRPPVIAAERGAAHGQEGDRGRRALGTAAAAGHRGDTTGDEAWGGTIMMKAVNLNVPSICALRFSHLLTRHVF